MDIKSEIYSSEHSPYERTPAESLSYLGVKLGAAYGIGRLADKLYIPSEKFRPANLSFAKDFTIQGEPWYEADGIRQQIQKRKGYASIRELILNAVKVSEEQLFKIPRSFSASTIHGTRVYSAANINIKGDDLKQQLPYLNKVSKGLINKQSVDLEKGLFYRNRGLYGSDGEELLKRAFVMPGRWAKDKMIGGTNVGYTSRHAESMYHIYGLNPAKSDFLISGGRSYGQILGHQANAFATTAVQNYMRLMDDPAELVSQFIGKTKFADQASEFMRRGGISNQFGVGGYQFMKGKSATQLLKQHFTRGLPKLAGAVAAYKTVDWMLRTTPGVEDTYLGYGLSGMAGDAYQLGTKGATKVSDITGLTTLSKAQEDVAPGSTSLLGLSAFPLSAAIFGGTIGGITNLVKGTTPGVKSPAPELFKEFVSYGESKSNLLSKLKLGSVGRVGAFAAIGAAVGGALALPFLPGALGATKDSDELDKIYSGEQLVDMKRGRFWTFGTSPYEGTDTEYFAPHWTVRAKTDAGRKGRYSKEHYNNPLMMFLERIIDPYAVERAQDEERPYTFWGPSDMGLGLGERLLRPLREVFKPTITAHSDAAGGIHPDQLKRSAVGVPMDSEFAKSESLDFGAYNYNVENPDSYKEQFSGILQSAEDLGGLHSFALGAAIENMTGANNMFTPPAVAESSGQILSAQRSYWDNSLGDMFGLNEGYRRLNPDREYATEYISSPIRNKMPEWIGKQNLLYGDPYAQIPMGELRLPGRGYAALHPEVEDVDPENYPYVHRLNILNSVAPDSSKFHYYRNLVEEQMGSGDLNEAGEDMYSEIMRQRDKKSEGQEFDTGEGLIGSYYLKLKQMGRALPTEALYPISPVHKFSGIADPLTEYKSFNLLDKQFKLWQHPISDFVMPAFNRTVDMFSMTDYIPGEARERADIESYFSALQYTKNQVLQQKGSEAADAGDYEAASFFQRGKRETLHGMSPYEDIGELTDLMSPRYRNQLKAMSTLRDPSQRESVMNVVNPEMQQILNAQWNKDDYMSSNDFEKLESVKKDAAPISGMDEELSLGGNMPDRDFIGYAPGVDLNAFKLKTVNNMGKNIRDYNLWREDEKNANILDAYYRGTSAANMSSVYGDAPDVDRNLTKRAMENYLSSVGVRNSRISAIPIIGNSTVDLQLMNNNESQIKEQYADNYNWN